MSVLTVTVAGTDIDYREVELARGISSARPTPEATVRRVSSAVETGDSITISEGGTTLFTGQVARPKVKSGGSRDLTCEHALAPLFEESVNVPPTTSVQSALSSALSNASTSATLSFVGSDVTLGDDYQATDRSVKRIFRDLTERTGRVWRIEEPDTVVVEPLGAGATIQIDTTADAAVVDSYDPGDVRTVVNDVTVNGTGGERVTGGDSDATSINDYGTRSDTVNVEYIRTEAEADDYASELLVPEPLAAAEVRVGAGVTDIVSDRTNAVIDLTDPSRDIAGVQLVIEEQTNASGGSAVFSAGEGAATDLVERNRQAKSDEDTTEPGSVYNTDRLGDDSVTTPKLVDTAVIEDKLADLAVSLQKVQDGAIDTVKITDNAIESPKILAGAVVAEKLDTDLARANRLLAGEIEALDIATDTLTANEIATLDLETQQLTIGTDASADRFIEFVLTEDDLLNDRTTMRPGATGTCLIGTESDPFAEVNSQEATFVGVEPRQDQTGGVGSTSRAYDSMYAYNYIDAGTGSAINDGGDPLTGLATGHGPPDTCEVCDDETGETKGYSVNRMARESWDVIRAQQRRIDDLETRLAALEGDTDPNA